MLFMVISTPRPEPPSAMTAKRKDYWRWLAPLQENGMCKGAWARAGRGAVILFDVPDNDTLHRLGGDHSRSFRHLSADRHGQGQGISRPLTRAGS